MGAYETKLVQNIVPGTYAVGDAEGKAVDCAGYDECVVILDCASVGGDTTLDVKIQDCDTSDGVFVDISGAACPQLKAPIDNDIFTGRIKTTRTRRWLRALGTVAVADTAIFAVAVGLASKKTSDQPGKMLFDVP